MKRLLPYFLRNLLFCCVLLLLSVGAKANHLVGADLYYTWISGSTYKVTLILYGDCGSGATSYTALPSCTPKVCVYNGTGLTTTLSLAIQAPIGVEITPVCPAQAANTQCSIPSSTIPGITKYVYSANYTLPTPSANWRFIFNGDLGVVSSVTYSAGRATSLTNISSVPVSTIRLEATLNSALANNSNPILTILPVPFFCVNTDDSYNPGAVDADADSLSFSLVDAANGGGGCTAAAGIVNYLTTYPYSGINPLHTTSGSIAFDPLTGQIQFFPDIIQRSVVVYTIKEFRNNILIGTMQREMSFKVITCTQPPPTGIMTSTTNPAGVIDDSTHFHICANQDSFDIAFATASTDPTLNITVTNSGVPAGCNFVVTNNGTPNPSVLVSWNSTGVTPGSYTFYVTFRDDACPINGQQTKAFTINIFPVPNVSYTIIDTNSCAHAAIVNVSPSGAGTPWTIRRINVGGASYDSITMVTGNYLDTFNTGFDTLVIYNAGSSFCNSRVAIPIDPPVFVNPSATFVNPTFCGNNDGSLTISGLNSMEADTLYYTLNGTPMTPLPIFSSSTGTYVMNNLCAGTISNLYVKYGACTSTPIGPFTLTNPPFTINRVEFQSPSACGFNDGWIKIIGMHPFQLDTFRYTKDGVPQTPVTYYVTGDSATYINNLGAGMYANIVANTTGACVNSPAGCVSNVLGPVTLTEVPIDAQFNYSVRLGCSGDTLLFNNLSTPLSSSAPLFYRWYFGDGGTDTSRNPTHIYHPTAATTYTIKLIITNTRCVDSFFMTVSLPAPIHALYTSSPDTFICQNSAVAFRDTSTGAITSYAWSFGDGTTAVGQFPTHTFSNTGTYVVTLVISDGIPCTDTFRKTVQVDSTSLISMKASDTVLCRGGQVTFEGTYTNIGLTGTTWNFGDGGGYANANPIQHAFDASGTLTITLTAFYRACATAITTRTIRVYENPNIYLGPDTAMCPGSQPIEFYDLINGGNPKASWLWNTGDMTSHIVATQAGYYSATVTIDGCIGADTVWVANDCYVNFPNIFTPNGDGVNDYFFPRNLLSRGLIEFEMNIYNRWGEKIYATKNIEGQGWDGKYNNEPQPQGVFIYQIDAVFKDGQKLHKQGNVTLVR